MNSIKITLIATSIFLVACGGNETTNMPLSKLQAKRDSLKLKYEELGKMIAEVEQQIVALDTGVKAPLVTVLNLNKSDFSSYFTVQGNVMTDKNAQVLPEIPGVIKKIYVKEGDKVTQGQPLVSIDDNLLRIQIQQLEMNLALANDLFQKQERLWKQNIGSEVQYLQAKNTKNNIEEQIKQVKETLNKYVINAPFTGTIDQIHLKEGEFASQMLPLLRIVNLSNMYMKADVSESYVTLVKSGIPVHVIIPNMDTIKTTIARVGNFIKPENRTFEITIAMPDLEFLKPNLVGSVRIPDYVTSNAITLKTSLIMHDAEDRSFVFVVDQSGKKPTVKKVILETGKSFGGFTEIKSGLTGGETIVEKGARKLVDGQEVRIK